jgi:purine-binding chemotaxis protein CheW
MTHVAHKIESNGFSSGAHDNSPKESYLVFSVNNGFYAAPLLTVREVTEYTHPKKVPHTQDFFLGVTNIRGEIVGVLDLSKRLSGEFCSGERRCMIVVNLENCALAIVVNSVSQVVEISNDEIDKKNPALSTENSYVGIAKIEGDLVTILNLQLTVDEKDFGYMQKLGQNSVSFKTVSNGVA